MYARDPSLIDVVARSPSGLVLPQHSAIEPIWTIASLEPLILVESQGLIQGTMHSYWHVDVQPDDSTRQPGSPTKASVFLNGGFHSFRKTLIGHPHRPLPLNMFVF